MTTIDEERRGPLIEVEGLRNQFGDQIVHENLDLEVYPGEIIGVVGGSGTGKTVLMRSILGLQPFRAGSIKIFGKPITGLADKEELEVRRRFGVLFQNGALFSTLTVAENVQVPLREFHKMTQDLMDEIAGYKIGLAGLGPEAGPKYPSELSGGMRKRAALARALALDPRLLFLDEPTAGLDPIGAAAFDRLILELRDALGLTVFLITHDLDTLYTICDRVAVLADRKVLAAAPIQELLEIDHPWLQDYFKGPRGLSAMAGDLENRRRADARHS